ncbi:MAG: methanogenesis marker 12 protein [Euryarchaeota archaeon]|nr:methanogenesis marker 12 protein [Euryarchaeota archaeon]
MSFLGMDHGTREIRFYLLPENLGFSIPRRRAARGGVLREIERRVELSQIELAAVTHGMGDAISAITPVERVENRGVLPGGGAGEHVGGGERAFDEIAQSGIKVVVIPGLHRGIACLDERMRALYSHMASAEKVGIAYDAYLKAKQELNAESLIVSDISSNTVNIAVREGRIAGAVDACLGAIGMLHGPLDLEAIRRIDAGELTANEAFSRGGAVKIFPFSDFSEVLEPKSKRARLALNALLLSVEMEIRSLTALVEPEAIVVTGGAGAHDAVFSGLAERLQKLAPVLRTDEYSAARGCAEIARAVHGGAREILGIEVEV